MRSWRVIGQHSYSTAGLHSLFMSELSIDAMDDLVLANTDLGSEISQLL